MAGRAPRPVRSDGKERPAYKVLSRTPAGVLRERLAFWESVDEVPTVQVLREATSELARLNGKAAGRQSAMYGRNRLPNRRCLRYGTHGLHEYRGKFFPQLVRSLLNVAGMEPGSAVADPMLGSGTTAVETVLLGYRFYGLDRNPLSAAMSKAKCGLLKAPASAIAGLRPEFERLLKNAARPSSLDETSYFQSLSEGDRVYLARWFAPKVLIELDVITVLLRGMSDKYTKTLGWLSLSNVLRRLSWQREADLRVRKVRKPETSLTTFKTYLAELERNAGVLAPFLAEQPDVALGRYSISVGDAREMARTWQSLVGRVDAVVTSPPYATALPYLDTDRLSLVYLKLLPRDEHRRADLEMIGNREITPQTRQDYLTLFNASQQDLPSSVVRLVREVERLNSEARVGFRRRNMAALLGKYFLDMHRVFGSLTRMLRPGARAFVVVGDNHTVAGGRRVDIGTTGLLADVAESAGLKHEGSIPMEMLKSRDIFKRNAVASEAILMFRRPR